MATSGPSAKSRRTFLRATLGGSAALLIGCESSGSGSSGSGAGPNDSADAGRAGDASRAADSSTRDAGSGGRGHDAGPEDGGGATDRAPDSSDSGDVLDPSAGCADPFAGGEYLGDVELVSEGTAPLNTPLNAGLNGRLYTDLSKLTQEDYITDVEDHYIRTRLPDQIDTSTEWSFTLTGMVGEDLTLTAADWEPLIEEIGPVLLECSGNGDFAHFGMLSTSLWHGVPVGKVFDLVDIDPASTRVVIRGFDGHSPPHPINSSPGAAWVFTLEQLQAFGAFFGTHMNGEPLTPDHGYPIRLVVPRWYGCCNVKWLDEVRFTDDSEPATSQMQEFAYRTHQPGVPALAVDYLPATIDQAAMPVRVERWRVDGEYTYKIVGILWGGYAPTDKLELQIGSESAPWQPIDVCPTQVSNDYWTVWTHRFTPAKPGLYDMRLRVNDPAVVTRRLDEGFYDRAVQIDDTGPA